MSADGGDLVRRQQAEWARALATLGVTETSGGLALDGVLVTVSRVGADAWRVSRPVAAGEDPEPSWPDVAKMTSATPGGIQLALDLPTGPLPPEVLRDALRTVVAGRTGRAWPQPTEFALAEAQAAASARGVRATRSEDGELRVSVGAGGAADLTIASLLPVAPLGAHVHRLLTLVTPDPRGAARMALFLNHRLPFVATGLDHRGRVVTWVTIPGPPKL